MNFELKPITVFSSDLLILHQMPININHLLTLKLS